jgi:hypothetical protein
MNLSIDVFFRKLNVNWKKKSVSDSGSCPQGGMQLRLGFRLSNRDASSNRTFRTQQSGRFRSKHAHIQFYTKRGLKYEWLVNTFQNIGNLSSCRESQPNETGPGTSVTGTLRVRRGEFLCTVHYSWTDTSLKGIHKSDSGDSSMEPVKYVSELAWEY